MYANGQGVPENDKTAVKWYRLAAEQGTAVAQYTALINLTNGHPRSKETGVQVTLVAGARFFWD